MSELSEWSVSTKPPQALRNYRVVEVNDPTRALFDVMLTFRIADEDAHDNESRRVSGSDPITAYDIAMWTHEWYTRPVTTPDQLRDILKWSNEHDESDKMDMLCDLAHGRQRFRHCDVYEPSYRYWNVKDLAISILEERLDPLIRLRDARYDVIQV